MFVLQTLPYGVGSKNTAEPQSLLLVSFSFAEPIESQPIDKLVSFPDALPLSRSCSIEDEMSTLLQPCHLLVLSVASWINREQQKVVAYLWTENQILREKLGIKRILLNDDQRRPRAVEGKVLGRRLLYSRKLLTPLSKVRCHLKTDNPVNSLRAFSVNPFPLGS